MVDRLLGTIDKGDMAIAVAGARTTLAQANALYQTRCNAVSFAACGLLGENLLAGIGASVDRTKGIALLEKACNGGVERAWRRVAEEKTR